ncbi:unnamed protein product [Moneuplotes crassus]|uniref:Uncharacterized protein n=1 Tax=Euplotes crassus TaxID=5936 RepID=A0AAD1UBF1_EUPCR|nr:unnamed protein product [Moneuplotes crassus]
MSQKEVRAILGDITNLESNYREKMITGGDTTIGCLDQIKLPSEEELLKSQSVLSRSSDNCNTEKRAPILTNDIVLKICYQNQNKILPEYPANMKTLHSSIKSLFSLDILYNLFFIDSAGDRIDISNNKDLKAICKTMGGQTSPLLKVYIWPKDAPLPSSKTGIAEVDSLWERIEKGRKLIRFNDKARDLAKNTGTQTQIIRKDCTYILEFSFEDRFFYKCWKFKQGCKGIWKINKKGGEGKLSRDHTMEDCGIKPQIKTESEERTKTLDQERECNDTQSDKKCCKGELNLRSRHFGAYRPFIRIIYSCIKEGWSQDSKKQVIKSENNIILPPIIPYETSLQKTSGVEVSKIYTKRTTPFGRAQVVSICNEQTNDLLFLVSDFELKILKSNHKSPQRYLLCCEEISDPNYRYVFNISMYDNTCKMFMPIGHCLMRYLKTQHFELIIAWFQKEFGTFFKPSLFITDYNFELFHACHVLYDKVPKYISLVDFIFKVWKNAYAVGMLTEKEVPDDHLKLLSDMPFLLLTHNEKTKDQFEKLVDNFLPLGQYERFVKQYMQIFLNVSSWYNIYTLASTYKNIFLNASKSQELQKKIFLSNRGLSGLEMTRNFESYLCNLHESISTGGQMIQPGSMYRLTKLYFNKYRGKKIKKNDILALTLNAMKDFDIEPNISSELSMKISKVKNEILDTPNIKIENPESLLL